MVFLLLSFYFNNPLIILFFIFFSLPTLFSPTLGVFFKGVFSSIFFNGLSFFTYTPFTPILLINAYLSRLTDGSGTGITQGLFLFIIIFFFFNYLRSCFILSYIEQYSPLLNKTMSCYDFSL